MDANQIQGHGQQKMRAAPRRYDGQNGNPNYDINSGGHYGASAQIAAQGHAPDPSLFSGTWSNVNQGLNGTYRDILNTYWQHQVAKLENDEHDYKIHQLPLARIKKVMKADPEVKMISAEAPILFAKGCDIFITELTMRAWIHAEENKRRTLQRSDIASALGKSDMFDFLIDIVPREDASPHKRSGGQANSAQQAGTAPQPAVPQPGVHPPPHEVPHAYMAQHVPPPEQEYRQPGMFPPHDPNNPYGQPQPQMFDQTSMYNAYAIPPQSMYPVGQRAPDPGVAGGGHGHAYRGHIPEGEADADGERDDYGPS